LKPTSVLNEEMKRCQSILAVTAASPGVQRNSSLGVTSLLADSSFIVFVESCTSATISDAELIESSTVSMSQADSVPGVSAHANTGRAASNINFLRMVFL
jgi:outer membrane receptor for Fe3+-dicitrate